MKFGESLELVRSANVDRSASNCLISACKSPAIL